MHAAKNIIEAITITTNSSQVLPRLTWSELSLLFVIRLVTSSFEWTIIAREIRWLSLELSVSGHKFCHSLNPSFDLVAPVSRRRKIPHGMLTDLLQLNFFRQYLVFFQECPRVQRKLLIGAYLLCHGGRYFRFEFSYGVVAGFRVLVHTIPVTDDRPSTVGKLQSKRIVLYTPCHEHHDSHLHTTRTLTTILRKKPTAV